MVEFLSEIRDLNFAGIMKEEVTEADTYRAMIEWYEKVKASPAENHR
jgi:hypothetical protein